MASYSLEPTQDTYVKDSNPTSNYDLNIYLTFGYLASEKSTEMFRAYVDFDVLSLGIAASGSVASGVIDIPLMLSNGFNTCKVVLASGVWDETTVTWNTQPGFSSWPYSTFTFVDDDEYIWKSVDVTQHIKEIISTNTCYGFVLAALDEAAEPSGWSATKDRLTMGLYSVGGRNVLPLVYQGGQSYSKFPGGTRVRLRIETL